MQLDETLAEAHIALAKIKSSYEWDWIGAENDYKRAIDLNPNNAEAHQSYGSFLLGQERFNEAVAETKKSSELEPLSVFYSVQVCRVYHRAGREDEALANCQTTLEMDANYPLTHFVLGQIYLEKEMYQEAFAEFQTNARLISSNNPPDLMVFAYYYAVTGNKDEAKKRLAELEELANKRFVPSDIIAIVYSALNDKDKTFEWLEKAYQQHYFHHQIKVTPLLKNIRNDARFKDLLERLKLRP